MMFCTFCTSPTSDGDTTAAEGIRTASCRKCHRRRFVVATLEAARRAKLTREHGSDASFAERIERATVRQETLL